MAVESESRVDGVIEMTPYRTTTEWEESPLIAFEKGYIPLELPAPLACNRAGKVEIYWDPGGGAQPVREEPMMPWVHAMQQQAKNFVRAIKGETVPPSEAHTAIEDLKVAREYIRMKNDD